MAETAETGKHLWTERMFCVNCFKANASLWKYRHFQLQKNVQLSHKLAVVN